MPTFRNETTGTENAIVGVSDGGRGVEGWSNTAYGVAGESKTSAGVRGTSVKGRGTEGWSTDSEGIVGISTNGNGVWGQTDGAGIGVVGTSKSGVGVVGRGGRLAGLFEGNVEVTGTLSISGVGFAVILARISALEVQVATLAQQVARLGGAVPVDTGIPTLSASQEGSQIRVKGGSFKPKTGIRIRFVVGQIGNEDYAVTTSLLNGTFSVLVPVGDLPSRTPIWVSATDGTPNPSDHTGVLWSNTWQLTYQAPQRPFY
jgi:hypothetical protein